MEHRITFPDGTVLGLGDDSMNFLAWKIKEIRAKEEEEVWAEFDRRWAAKKEADRLTELELEIKKIRAKQEVEAKAEADRLTEARPKPPAAPKYIRERWCDAEERPSVFGGTEASVDQAMLKLACEQAGGKWLSIMSHLRWCVYYDEGKWKQTRTTWHEPGFHIMSFPSEEACLSVFDAPDFQSLMNTAFPKQKFTA